LTKKSKECVIAGLTRNRSQVIFKRLRVKPAMTRYDIFMLLLRSLIFRNTFYNKPQHVYKKCVAVFYFAISKKKVNFAKNLKSK
jgi:hypothetical protein